MRKEGEGERVRWGRRDRPGVGEGKEQEVGSSSLRLVTRGNVPLIHIRHTGHSVSHIRALVRSTMSIYS